MRKEMRQEIESRMYKHTPEWREVIHNAIQTMPQPQQELYRLRYIERQSERVICSQMHIERSTYYAWITGMINDIAIAAAYNRLIKPEAAE